MKLLGYILSSFCSGLGLAALITSICGLISSDDVLILILPIGYTLTVLGVFAFIAIREESKEKAVK